MPTDTKLTSQVEVLEWLAKNHPEMHAAAEIDRNWIWLVGDFRGCGQRKCQCALCQERAKLRESIKSVGFRFKFDSDHVLPSGKASRWGHSCGRPIPGKRKGNSPSKRTGEQAPQLSDEEILAALGV